MRVPPVAVHAHLYVLVFSACSGSGKKWTRVVGRWDSLATSGDDAVADAGGSGCDSASDSDGEPNEPSGCCADADVEDRNGLDVEICVRLGDEVTAAM